MIDDNERPGADRHKGRKLNFFFLPERVSSVSPPSFLLFFTLLLTHTMNVFRFKSNSAASVNNSEPKVVDNGPVTHEPILTPPADYSPSLPPALDESQQQKLEQLRQYIESIMLPKDHEYYPSERGFVTDGTLKRYMRARKWDYEVTITISIWVMPIKTLVLNMYIHVMNRQQKTCWRILSSGVVTIVQMNWILNTLSQR